jgi:hypothetical protein
VARTFDGGKPVARKPRKRAVSGAGRKNIDPGGVFGTARNFEHAANLVWRDFMDAVMPRRVVEPTPGAPSAAAPTPPVTPTNGHPDPVGTAADPAIRQKGRLAPFFPACVNSAFCLELYFKCLILLDTGRAAKGHQFRELFNKLSAKTKKRVEEFYYQACGFDPRLAQPPSFAALLSIDHMLNWCNDAYQVFRYPFEELPTTISSPPTHLIAAVKKAILEFRPEWGC